MYRISMFVFNLNYSVIFVSENNFACYKFFHLELLLSAAKVLVQMQEKRILTLSFCLTMTAEIEWGNIMEEHGDFTAQKLPCKQLKRMFYSKEESKI